MCTFFPWLVFVQMGSRATKLSMGLLFNFLKSILSLISVNSIQCTSRSKNIHAIIVVRGVHGPGCAGPAQSPARPGPF